MNLAEFILKHQENGTLEYIRSGFQKSQFAINASDIAALMKTILTKLLNDSDRQKIYNQLQSGGLPANLTTQSKAEACKKQSFCAEFSMMISNIIGLFGFEMSKYLMILFGAKHFVQLILDEMKCITTYTDMAVLINYIKNIYELGHGKAIFLSQQFDEQKYIKQLNGMTIGIHGNNINYFNSTINESREDKLFTAILTYIDNHIRNENIISFADDKKLFCDVVQNVIDNTELGTYEINDINELVINLGRFNVCYDKSFIKMFELLYQEGFSDLPAELRVNYKPHVVYLENDLKLDIKCDKYLLMLNKYFHDVYDNTLKSILEIKRDDYIDVVMKDEVYEMMSDIVLNLFVNMCRKIYNNQLIYGYFGKSTRIQFIQIFQAFIDSIPRFYTLTNYQRMVVHYILLSDKVINDSINAINKLSSKSNVGSKSMNDTNVLNVSSDDSTKLKRKRIVSRSVKRSTINANSKDSVVNDDDVVNDNDVNVNDVNDDDVVNDNDVNINDVNDDNVNDNDVNNDINDRTSNVAN